MIKNTILITALLFSSMFVLAQEQEYPDILATDSTWGKEFFPFPIRFARAIDFQGLEDARFPKGWGDINSPEFWSYAFAWKIEVDQALSETDMEVNLQHYFDGLLGLPSEGKEGNPKTNAIFIEKETAHSNSFYTGKIKTVDTRFTKKPMTLHVQVEQHYCQQIKKSIILFKFSPKAFENNLWLKLAGVKLRDDICEN